jgi:hypothetical protein
VNLTTQLRVKRHVMRTLERNLATSVSLCKARASLPMAANTDLERALELVDARPAEAVTLLRAVVLAPLPQAGSASGPDDTKTRETAVTTLTSVLAKQRDAPALRALLGELRPLFAALPKAKTAKLVRTVIDAVATIPDTTALQVCLSPCAVTCDGARCAAPRPRRGGFS